MRVGLAYPAFKKCFQVYYPDLIVIDRDTKKTRECDLIIFSGGEDLNPEIYGQSNTASYGVNDERDHIERDIFYMAMDEGKKVLGVCRGHQLINALSGGNLVQDIRPVHPGFHPIEILKNFSILNLSYTSKMVNSMHHQGVTRTGRGAQPTSAFNNLVESCESDRIISVQFHPEFSVGEEPINFFKYITLWVEHPREYKKELEKIINKNEEEKIKILKQSLHRSTAEQIAEEYRTFNTTTTSTGYHMEEPNP